MLSEDHKNLMRRYHEEVVSIGAVDEVTKFISSKYPDLHLTVEQQIAQGEWVATDSISGRIINSTSDPPDHRPIL